jgi:hypothetical protein
MISLAASLVALGLTLSAPQDMRSGAQICFAVDSAEKIVGWVKAVATRTDAASTQQRAMMQLPLVSEREVTRVTDERICQGVLNEDNKFSGTRSAITGLESPPSERACVVKVRTLYVVTDPTKMFGEFTIYVTTDSTFRMLAHVLG